MFRSISRPSPAVGYQSQSIRRRPRTRRWPWLCGRWTPRTQARTEWSFSAFSSRPGCSALFLRATWFPVGVSYAPDIRGPTAIVRLQK